MENTFLRNAKLLDISYFRCSQRIMHAQGNCLVHAFVTYWKTEGC